MAKVLPSLDESEPVHGDLDTVTALAEVHKVREFSKPYLYTHLYKPYVH